MTPAEQAQLDAVAALVRRVLGRDVVGVYLHGSAALGSLRPRSDLDVLALTSRRTTRAERQGLVSGLLALSGGDSRHLEVTVVVQDEIRPWRFPPRLDFQYGDWWRAEFERGDLEPWPSETDPDLALLLTMVLLADWPLHGPPAAEMIDPVPWSDVVTATLDTVEVVLDQVDDDTRNMVLTLARMWCTLATGEIRSKDAAADWALERLPEEHRAVLARARAVYVGDEEERWADLETAVRPHAELVASEIRRVATTGNGLHG